MPDPTPRDTARPDASRPDPARLLAEARAAATRRIAALTGQVEDVVAASDGSNADDEHDPEGATIAFERSQLGALLREARAQLAEVEAAEDRLERGDYGRCESCGAPVAPARLEARPTARTCIDCASRAAADHTASR